MDKNFFINVHGKQIEFKQILSPDTNHGSSTEVSCLMLIYVSIYH